MLPSNIIYLYVCPGVGSTYADIMADLNIPANDAPVEQAPAVAPLTRTDDQILPLSKAFTASSTIPAIYIQQFWDTMCFNSSTGLYSCQLDKQWFNLHKDILRDALNITPGNDNNPFVALPSSDTVIEYVNTLGYPSLLRTYPQCKTAGFDRPRHPVLQMLWGIIHSSNIDYAERIWEEFVQSIQTFLTDRKNLAKASREKKRIRSSAYQSVRVPYYNGYLEHVAEYQRYLDKEHDKADDKTPKPTSSQPSKPTPTPTEPSQKDQDKIVKYDEGVRVEEPAYNEEKANLQRALELSLKEQGERTQGPARPVVLRDPDSGRIQPLPDRRTPMPTEASGHVESPSLDAELALTDSETESDNEVPKINTGDQDEGQAGPNPVPAGPNLEHMDLEATDASTQQKPEQMDEEFTTTAYPNVQENLKLPTEDQVILEEPASSSGTLSSLQNLEKDLSFTDQFFVEKPQEEEPGKTNAEAEVQSMVSVPIHQDTSSVPPMTTPVIDLTKSQSDSPLPTSTATISTITTTTTTLPPPPPQPQQSTADPILVKRIGELEQHMADLIQNNLALEERLDKQGSRLYNLENLNIPHKVSQAVDEIVTDAVDWAMQAPLRARFRDLPTVDMKEILQQRMFEDNSYKAHDVHNDLYEALQKSLELDYLNQRLTDQEEARKKRRKRRASGSSQFLPPPPPLSTGTSGSTQQQGSNTPSSTKTTALASQSIAWTTSDTRYESVGVSVDQELSPTDSLMHEDSILDKQVHLFNDEDSGNDHLPKADSRKDWWKPLQEEERPQLVNLLGSLRITMCQM
ncbi:retrovirus-related pol polyprotein from transposon TNT 1-94 [Tanacetum coccineum]